MRTVSIAKEFSRYPGGRFERDGPYSGEEFRARYLIPALQAREKLVIAMDGVRGYGSSFLEEAFGGLVRLGFEREFVRDHLTFETENPSLKLEVEEYISQAKQASGVSH
jgi:hypothetical protein